MIDLIKMSKTGLTNSEIFSISEDNNLQTNSKAGVFFFDNQNQKFIQGFYLRIETSKAKRLKLECSLHKFFNYIRTGKQANFDLFSITNARQSLELLKEKTGIEPENLNVNYYEIGLNLYMEKDCRTYIDQMQTIGVLDNKRRFFVNPRYKGERVKTTVFHRHIKKVYKVYDKVHEMRDKQRKDIPEATPNILRIETTQRRVEKLTVADLMTPKTIKKLTDQFLKDWRTVQFDPAIEAKKGTHQRKISLCQKIILFGKEEVLKMAKEDFAAGKLTEKRYRNKREFIGNEWDIFKKTIQVEKAPEEMEFREKINEAIEIVKL
ncbi:hypothetical protein [uncultured Sunxiuqinia sp.]|uniref:hypothetical protein n=1 Tax=uncultured Sunxiuqinia sp. TaxID=1573825 RepID=UPI002AA7D263|nr:hypothetical protein [uncultured Sunxiuqinia sp.]